MGEGLGAVDAVDMRLEFAGGDEALEGKDGEQGTAEGCQYHELLLALVVDMA